MGLRKSFHLILMHFFIYNFSMLWGEVASNSVDFQKLIFFYNFDRSSLFFDQLKLRLKISMSLCLVRLIEPVFRSIEHRESSFLKKLRFDLFIYFFKLSSLSLRLGKAPLRIFCRFQPNFLQGFSLPRPVRPLYPSFCFYFHDFMHKLMHFNGIFETFHIWDFCWINPLFLKLIIGFCSYIVIFMI